MTIHGIYCDRLAADAALAKTLRTDDMERYSAVPRTVMINQWPDDLNWVIVDHTYPAQIRRRQALLLARHDMVIDRLPGQDIDAAERELLDMVVDYVLATYPQYFQRETDLVLSPLTGLVIDIGPGGADPLVAIALLASEDMLLLLPQKRRSKGGTEETVYLLKAGALLFPNDWSLRSRFNQPKPDSRHPEALAEWRAAKRKSLQAARLGKSPSEIHDGHVAHYMQHFSSRVDLFFSRMEPGMRTWRRNWGMRLTDELFLHSDALPASLPPLTPQSWSEHGYLRSEHETFTKLPKSEAVVFSIKTYLWKLSELVRNPAALHALIVANDNLAPTMFAYRAESLPTFREFLEQHRPVSNSF